MISFMTPIQTLSVPLVDIQHIDIVCNSCKSLTRLSLPRIEVPAPFACCGCNRQLWNCGDVDHRLLLDFMRALSAYINQSAKIPFHLSFSLSEPNGN